MTAVVIIRTNYQNYYNYSVYFHLLLRLIEFKYCTTYSILIFFYRSTPNDVGGWLNISIKSLLQFFGHVIVM